jgi:hypothetical protein
MPGPMSHLFMGVQEQSYIAHVVDHATETWKKDGYKRVISAAGPAPTLAPILILCTLLAFNV